MTAPVKRFMLFAHDNHYPSGGWGDFVSSFDTLDEAKAAAIDPKVAYYDSIEIIDQQTGEAASGSNEIWRAAKGFAT